MPEPLSPAIAAVAAVMDEIDGCRNPMPCELCRQRMQSILDMGAAAERERIRTLFGDWIEILMSEPNSHPPSAWKAAFDDLLNIEPS